jgi:Tfp pilus assembly protein PilX
MKTKNESGIALITVLLILVLMGALLQTFIVKVISSQKMMGMDMRTNRTDRINPPAAP